MPGGPYHSALAGNRALEVAPLGVASFDDGIAFRHNVFDPLPVAYATCDVIYAEPPWRGGYATFNRRAGVTAEPDWASFMARVGELIGLATAPVCCHVGATGLKHLPPTTAVYETTLNGAAGLLACWRTTLSAPQTTETAVAELCARPDVATIGDWCCGYGRTAVAARTHGKRFVVSDHNAECIGAIAVGLAG